MVLRIRHHNHRITAQLNRTSGLFRGSIPLRLPVVSSNTWEERGSADLHDSPVADASTGRPPSFQWSDCGSPNLASVPPNPILPHCYWPAQALLLPTSPEHD